MSPLSITSKKLSITGCSVDSQGVVHADGANLELLINPADYSHERKIKYSTQTPLGALSPKLAFSWMEAETVTFKEIVFDGTGVVRPIVHGPVPNVKDQIDKLIKIIYQYKGSRHEPSWVRLLWGSLIFFGRLTSMSANYTLFSPGGVPLRAKLNLSFQGAMSAEEQSLRSNRSSPDLSHCVEVRAGDTLPLLCHRIYRDSSYYLEVARFNKLSSFRELKPGMQLLFPPLG